MSFDNVNINVSGPVQPTSIYKTKVLKGNHSFASQVTEPNMKYVIKHDFVLNGDVTVPANCVLEFDGGSISGTYKLDFNNATLLGNPKIACDFKGDIKNDVIYLKWFTSSDEILVKLNKVLQPVYPSTTNNNKKIVIPNGIYEITVPIEIRYNKGIDIDFSGAELIDKVDIVHPLTHHRHAVIYLRDVYNIKIHNAKYTYSNIQRENTGGYFVSIGGPHVTTLDYNPSDIEIYDIIGDTSLSTDSASWIEVIGECYNINIHDIFWTGSAYSAHFFNAEYSIAPESKEDMASNPVIGQHYADILPDYYGAHPYNIVLKNIYFNSFKGEGLRISAAYNILIDNIYGLNHDGNIIQLYGGDDGIYRAPVQVVCRNIAVFNEEQKNKECIFIVNTGKNPQESPRHLIHAASADYCNIILENVSIRNCGTGIRVNGFVGNFDFRNIRIVDCNLGIQKNAIAENKGINVCNLTNVIIENVAQAGLIDCSDGELNINNCYFKSDSPSTARTYGLVIYGSIGNIKISNTIFEDFKCTTPTSGGNAENATLCIDGAKVVLIENTVFKNVDKAFYCRFADTVTFNNCKFEGGTISSNNIHIWGRPTNIIKAISIRNCVFNYDELASGTTGSHILITAYQYSSAIGVVNIDNNVFDNSSADYVGITSPVIFYGKNKGDYITKGDYTVINERDTYVNVNGYSLNYLDDENSNIFYIGAGSMSAIAGCRMAGEIGSKITLIKENSATLTLKNESPSAGNKLAISEDIAISGEAIIEFVKTALNAVSVYITKKVTTNPT